MIRDALGDIGNEPSWLVDWKSPDIWNTYPDTRGDELHYPVQVGVQNWNSLFYRIKNVGCEATTGDEVIRLYWTNSNANGGWEAAFMPNDGNEITGFGGEDLPEINPGTGVVDYVNYVVQEDWVGIPENGRGKVCLYARSLDNSSANSVNGPESENVYINANENFEITARNSVASHIKLDGESIKPSSQWSLFTDHEEEPEEDKGPGDPGNDGNGTIVGNEEDVPPGSGTTDHITITEGLTLQKLWQ